MISEILELFSIILFFKISQLAEWSKIMFAIWMASAFNNNK